MIAVHKISLFPWLGSPHGFCKHSREQYEKLAMMHKNMQKLYEGLGNFFAFDPHSVSMEDFFGDLANFRVLFLVSTWWLCKGAPRVFFPLTRAAAAAATHTYIILHVHLFANTHLVSSSSRCVLASEAEGPGRGWKHAWELQCYNHSRYWRQLAPHAVIFWLCLLIFAYFSKANTANQSAADRKFLLCESSQLLLTSLVSTDMLERAICFVNSSICYLFLKALKKKKKTENIETSYLEPIIIFN